MAPMVDERPQPEKRGTIMRINTLIATVAMGGGIVAGATMLTPAVAQTDPGTGHAASLTLHELQLTLEAMGYRDLTKIEREHDQWEIKAVDAEGQRVKLEVDPFSGNILDTEVRRGAERQADTIQASWLTLHQVQVKLEAMGYRDIEEIEREHDRYEAKAADAQGHPVKLVVHPRSGDITIASRRG
jgi:hypothetical protein